MVDQDNPDELLMEDLQAPTYEVRNGKVRIMNKQTMRELLRRSPDRADALCLTFAEDRSFLSGCEINDFPGFGPMGAGG